MNILCIANEIGMSAAGIVYDTIIKELSLTNKVYVICPDISLSCLASDSVTILPTISLPNDLRWSLKTMSARLFGINITDYIGVKKHIARFDYGTLPRIDCILSFVSQQKYFGLLLGKYLSKSTNVKWAIYCVDAIPSPWTKSYFLKNRIRNVFCNLVRDCDLFISANPQMLQYQLKNMQGFTGSTEVVYTPSQTISLPDSKSNSNDQLIFLYSGSLYGLRRIDPLIGAYRKLLNVYPETKIVFVGHHQNNTFAECQDLIKLGRIEVYPTVRDLSDFYANAAVLLDISADVSNDVFLSSKIATYLQFKKPIVCISGNNSPVTNIFTGDKTIIHCNYCIDTIYAAMKSAISVIGVESINRDFYIQMFSAQQNCQRLISAITAIKFK